MATSEKMLCPNCGAEMNHHCDKLVYATELQDIGQTDSGLGGIIEEFHACPKCGVGVSRHAQE